MDGEEFLSIAWICRLLKVFLQCQEEFQVLVAHTPRREFVVQTKRLLVDYYERAVKALDLYTASRDGFDKVRRWGHLASIAASVLLAPGKIHEGKLRRARKALSALPVFVDYAATGGGDGVASHREALSALSAFIDYAATGGGDGVASHRDRSFGRGTRSSPSGASSISSSPPSSSVSSSLSSSHSPSLSWSMPPKWSTAQQLQAIGSGLAAPRAHEAGLAAPVYAMGCMLHLASWALVAAVPCPDRGAALQAHHIPAVPPRAGFSWAPPLLALQYRLTEEGKRKDRRNSWGLLKEIHALEKCAQRLAEAIDAAAVPFSGESDAEVREAAAELAAVCAAVEAGLEPLERQVLDVIHRIVRSRMEGFDSPSIPNNTD